MADFFLKIGDIKGESQHDLHKDWIELNSFSFGVSTEGTVFKPAEAVGQDFNFVASVSRASPPLFLAVITGEHFKEAFLTARRASQDQSVFLKYSLDDVIVTSHQQGGLSTAELLPTDQFSIDFAKLKVEYFPQKADGSLDAPVTAVWDKTK